MAAAIMAGEMRPDFLDKLERLVPPAVGLPRDAPCWRIRSRRRRQRALAALPSTATAVDVESGFS
jgi:hypothetical protein